MLRTNVFGTQYRRFLVLHITYPSRTTPKVPCLFVRIVNQATLGGGGVRPCDICYLTNSTLLPSTEKYNDTF